MKVSSNIAISLPYQSMSEAKAPAAKSREQVALAADLKDSLVRYHQLEGSKNGSGLDGVQYNPLAPKSEQGLSEHIDSLTKFLAVQEDIAFRPSPKSGSARSEYRAELATRSAAYVRSSAKQMLEQAVSMIGDPALKQLAKLGLETAPKLFYTAPSSSSGRYHPADEINDGGLVLHTARVVSMANHLADYYGVSSKERDLLTTALILHDSRKGGDANWSSLKDYAPDHGDVAAKAILELKGADSTDGKTVARLAANHMAQWTQVVDSDSKTAPNGRVPSRKDPRPPADKLEQIVSYADYLAAQDNVYVLPPGYEADYLKEIPLILP